MLESHLNDYSLFGFVFIIYIVTNLFKDYEQLLILKIYIFSCFH